MNELNKAFEMYISRDYIGDVTTICRICKVKKDDLFTLLQKINIIQQVMERKE